MSCYATESPRGYGVECPYFPCLLAHNAVMWSASFLASFSYLAPEQARYSYLQLDDQVASGWIWTTDHLHEISAQTISPLRCPQHLFLHLDFVEDTTRRNRKPPPSAPHCSPQICHSHPLLWQAPTCTIVVLIPPFRYIQWTVGITP